MALPACTQDRSRYTVQRETVEGLPSVVATGEMQAQVKVQAVDYTSRQIALTGRDGQTYIFYARPEVKRLEDVRPGDTVKLRYNSRMCINVLRVGETPGADLTEAMIPADKPDKPGIACFRHGRIVANVDNIDYKTRVVKLKPTAGDTIIVKASKKLKGLEKVHAGDQVSISYIELASINVD
jgi:hypothetical protein